MAGRKIVFPVVVEVAASSTLCFLIVEILNHLFYLFHERLSVMEQDKVQNIFLYRCYPVQSLSFESCNKFTLMSPLALGIYRSVFFMIINDRDQKQKFLKISIFFEFLSSALYFPTLL